MRISQRKKPFVLLSFILTLAIVASSVEFSIAQTTSSAPKTIKIGAAVSLTGMFATTGVQLKESYEMAVANVNKDGGIYLKQFGKKIPVELILYDDESDSTKTVTRYETLATMDKVVGYLSAMGSGANNAVAPLAEKNKIPFVEAFSTDLSVHEQGYKYLAASPFIHADAYVRMMDFISEIAKENGVNRPKTIATVMSRMPSSMVVAELFKKEAPAHGYKVVVDEKYAFGTTDFSSAILKAKAANADIWFSIPSPPEGINIMRQMKELDYNPGFVGMPIATSSKGWPGKAGDLGEYAGTPHAWHWDLPFPGNKQFVEDMTKKLGTKPWVDHGCAYIVAQVMFNAIEQAGTLDRDKIRSALAATDMMTIGGRYRFDSKGLPIDGTTLFNQWQKGVYQTIWPKKFATAKAVYPMPKWSERR